MACPYFEPTRRTMNAGALLPLRDFWSGVCHAEAAVFEPDEHLLHECCNMGYARGKCTRFPSGSGPDTVRFTITADSGQMIVVSFATEKDHYPHSYGVLEFSRAAGKFQDAHPDSLLEKQAGAYLASYLRRRPASA